ncbi:MAG TPA: hypothetical protein VM925_13440 [Labilithrix sp.]|nr:hypothetical protein [Labilithrix sp.]
MKWTNRLGKWLFIGGAWTTTALMLGAVGTGCLARPVGQQPPTTKVNFTNTVSQQAVDKVDLLFAIDNSASMGDKQQILADAVPDLINGLLKPRCVDAAGKADGANTLANPEGNTKNRFGCPEGYEPEFKPVTDMHIGVVSSSLGNFGGDVCLPSNVRTNDRAHLLNIKKGGGSVDLASQGNFLAWFPQSEENSDPNRHPAPPKPVRTIEGAQGLTENFRELVIGVDQNGCGLEAQLESVYRFLIQPDPWLEVTLDPATQQATLGETVDRELLVQRADFLRPDSLVAIIMLTDEDDSSADPLAVNGQGWAFMSKLFPGSKVFRNGTNQGTTAPRGTKACDTNPGGKECNSCAFVKDDPNCSQSGMAGQSGEGYNGFYASDDDDLNVRFHRMKQRYGIDPQYPIKRYVDGFTKYKVPDRSAEHVINKKGARPVIDAYTSTPKCTNPLFASALPRDAQTTDQLCNLPRSTRSPDLIFFAVVGGVPNQLLHFTPNDPEASRITNEDWVKILGSDPANYRYDGIDPHMIQSVAPRTQYGLTGADLPRGDNGTDPYHGREWQTKKGDLQYACTFALPQPRECVESDPSCDCTPNAATNPPLCGSGNQQIKAKAYPTIREFQVVRALGEQGIIASLCPIQLDKPTEPTYGYRPAVSAIIDRLKNALTSQCLPQKLRTAEAEDKSEVPCLVLAQLGEPSDTCSKYGLEEPAPAILKIFREQQREESGNVGDGGLDFSKLPVCKLPQVTVPRGETCREQSEMAWCYVEKAGGKTPAGPTCAQGLIFTGGTAALAGARFSLQCINQFAAGEAAGDTQ